MFIFQKENSQHCESLDAILAEVWCLRCFFFFFFVHVNIWLFALRHGRLPLNLFLPSAGVCSRISVLNKGEFRVTGCHVASIYPCWDVGSPATITLTPYGTEIKLPVIHNTVRFVLVLERFFSPEINGKLH